MTERDDGLSPAVVHSGDNLLTDAEHALVGEIGDLAARFAEIAGDGPNAGNDLAEVVPLIHALQNHVLANAAARAYPQYRTFGGTCIDTPDGVTVGGVPVRRVADKMTVDDRLRAIRDRRETEARLHRATSGLATELVHLGLLPPASDGAAEAQYEAVARAVLAGLGVRFFQPGAAPDAGRIAVYGELVDEIPSLPSGAVLESLDAAVDAALRTAGTP